MAGRISPLSLLQPSALPALAQAPVLPAANVHPIQRNYRGGPPAPDGATSPRCPPATPRPHLAAPHIAALHRHYLRVPAMPSDLISRSALAAATPDTHTLLAPCNPATSPLHALLTPGLPHSFVLALCSKPPAACLPAYLHGPAPLHPVLPHALSAVPRDR